MNRPAFPSVMLLPSPTSTGATEYHPANALAVILTKFVGRQTLSNAHIPLIEEMGFRVIMPNGQPLPPAKAYQRPQPEVMRVSEEA